MKVTLIFRAYRDVTVDLPEGMSSDRTEWTYEELDSVIDLASDKLYNAAPDWEFDDEAEITITED